MGGFPFSCRFSIIQENFPKVPSPDSKLVSSPDPTSKPEKGKPTVQLGSVGYRSDSSEKMLLDDGMRGWVLPLLGIGMIVMQVLWYR